MCLLKVAMCFTQAFGIKLRKFSQSETRKTSGCNFRALEIKNTWHPVIDLGDCGMDKPLYNIGRNCFRQITANVSMSRKQNTPVATMMDLQEHDAFTTILCHIAANFEISRRICQSRHIGREPLST